MTLLVDFFVALGDSGDGVGVGDVAVAGCSCDGDESLAFENVTQSDDLAAAFADEFAEALMADLAVAGREDVFEGQVEIIGAVIDRCDGCGI